MKQGWKNQCVRLMGKVRTMGLLSVFSSNVLCKVLSFLGGMVLIRVLSKNDYGAYTYIMNCYSMLMLLYDCGCSVAAMQFCSENHKNSLYFNDYFTYGFKRGLLFSAISSLLILFSPFFYPFQTAQAATLSASLFLMPFLATINGFLLINLRIRLENRRYAVVNMFNTVIYYLIILPLSFWFGIRGAVWSNYLITGSVLLFTLWISRGYLSYCWKDCHLNSKEKTRFLKLAFASQLNNGIDHALMLLDVFLIGIFIGSNEVISSYKVATTIPSALAFIPASVMVCVIPYFSRNIGRMGWLRTQCRRLLLVGVIGNGLLTTSLILLGPWIVPLIFGSQYRDAVVCFQILMVGYFFSGTFRLPISNILYTQRLVRCNLAVTVLSGISNCILDVLLILHWGSVGAAMATTAVHIISSALNLFFLQCYLKRQEQAT